MGSRIEDHFKKWVNAYKKETDNKRKELLNERMIGCIIGLELAGKNYEASRCKEIYEQVKK